MSSWDDEQRAAYRRARMLGQALVLFVLVVLIVAVAVAL